MSKNQCQFLFQPGMIGWCLCLTTVQLGGQTKTGFEDKQQVVALLGPVAPVGERGMTVTATKILKKLLVIAGLRLLGISIGPAHAL